MTTDATSRPHEVAADYRSARRCPACGKRDTTPAFVHTGFEHVRCRGCGTLFVSPLPDPSTIAGTYLQPDYHEDVETAATRMRQEAAARARIVADLGVRSLLEVGCGAGYFLEAVGALGIEAEGVDPSRTGALAQARGLKIHRGWLEEFEPGRTYDAAAMFEVLEHVPEPVQMLRRVRTMLRPGGKLALSTPSFSGLPARLLGRRFPMVCPPDHLELFSRTGLGELLSRGGFRPLRWTSFSNLDGESLARNFRRFFLGNSTVGRLGADVLGRVASAPVRWLDRAGLGISYEVYAEVSE
jgi:SAM-dependent methyltransferase